MDKRIVNKKSHIITVNCPRDSWVNIEMELVIHTFDDGSKFPMPCNGCEQCNGSEICEKCKAIVTSMFFRNPDMQIIAPLKIDLNYYDKL